MAKRLHLYQNMDVPTEPTPKQLDEIEDLLTDLGFALCKVLGVEARALGDMLIDVKDSPGEGVADEWTPNPRST